MIILKENKVVNDRNIFYLLRKIIKNLKMN